MRTRGEKVLEKLEQRWWTQRDLGKALRIRPSLLRWHILQIAKRRPVFARQVNRPPFPPGPRPRAYRVYQQAFQVTRKEIPV
jgi:hypothetical protein